MNAVPQERRRILRRLRLPALLLLCTAVGWLALRLYQARREANAVAAIEKAGGQVVYDFQRGQSLSGPARPRSSSSSTGE